MTSRIIRQLVPPAAGIIGMGIGYLSGGTNGASTVNATAAPAVVPAAELPGSPDIPYAPSVAGLTQAMSENKGARREWLADSLTMKMSAADLAAIAERIETFPRDEQYPLMPRVMAAWALLDPHAAEQWLIQHAPTFRKGSGTFLKSLAAFAKAHPARAFEMLESLPPGERREKMAAAAATELAKINPRQAAELAAAVRDEKARKEAETGVLSGIAYADPLSALARIKDMPQEQRTSLVTTALNRLFSQDVGTGFNELAKLPASEQSQHIQSLAWRYANRAPQAFADFVEKNQETGPYSSASYVATYAATAMAATDPEHALNWAQSLGAVTRTNAVHSALNAWSAKDPAAAMAWAIKNKPDPAEQRNFSVTYDGEYFDGPTQPAVSGNSHVSAVLREWARSDPAAVLAWTKTGDGTQFRQEAAAALLVPELAEGRIDSAKELISQLPPERQQAAMLNAIGSIVQSNPSKAAELLTTLPASDRTPMLYGNLVQSWASSDIAATAEWIEKLPQSPSRDSAALAYAQRISAADPSAAMEWALGTTAGEQRSGTIAALYFQWARKQPAAAANWLENVGGLSANERQNLQSYKE